MLIIHEILFVRLFSELILAPLNIIIIYNNTRMKLRLLSKKTLTNRIL